MRWDHQNTFLSPPSLFLALSCALSLQLLSLGNICELFILIFMLLFVVGWITVHQSIPMSTFLETCECSLYDQTNTTNKKDQRMVVGLLLVCLTEVSRDGRWGDYPGLSLWTLSARGPDKRSVERVLTQKEENHGCGYGGRDRSDAAQTRGCWPPVGSGRGWEWNLP